VVKKALRWDFILVSLLRRHAVWPCSILNQKSCSVEENFFFEHGLLKKFNWCVWCNRERKLGYFLNVNVYVMTSKNVKCSKLKKKISPINFRLVFFLRIASRYWMRKRSTIKSSTIYNRVPRLNAAGSSSASSVSSSNQDLPRKTSFSKVALYTSAFSAVIWARG